MSSISSVSSASAMSPSDHAAAMFKKMDTDSDGKVSKSDFESVVTGDGMTTEQADDLFSQIDADGDGTITESENSSFKPQGPPPGGGNGPTQDSTTTSSSALTSVDAYA